MDISNFGKMIYKLRKKHNLTQNELAKLLNVNQRTYSRYENREHAIPLTILSFLADNRVGGGA